MYYWVIHTFLQMFLNERVSDIIHFTRIPARYKRGGWAAWKEVTSTKDGDGGYIQT